VLIAGRGEYYLGFEYVDTGQVEISSSGGEKKISVKCLYAGRYNSVEVRILTLSRPGSDLESDSKSILH
jgi:hypothetical protein